MIKIKFTQFLDGYHQEKIEDKIKRLLHQEKINATIENTETGNEMRTFPERKNKGGNND